VKQAALLGSGIGYSLSPAMHNAAFASLGMDCRYLLLDIAPHELPDTLQDMRRTDWLGANVTIPFKQEVVPLLDTLSPGAALAGAVNTIICREGNLRGENTDIDGFRDHLQALGWLAQPGSAILFGAGGAARAAALALLDGGWQVVLIARTPSRAEPFAGTLEPALRHRLHLQPWHVETVRQAAGDAALVVNATPLGGFKAPGLSPWPETLQPPPAARFYDMTYNPRSTRFLEQGTAAGLPVSGGLGMLVGQGARSFSLWTGIQPDRRLMLAAALHELEEPHATLSDSR